MPLIVTDKISLFLLFFSFFLLEMLGGDLIFFRKLQIVLVIRFFCIFVLDGKEDNGCQCNLDLITFSCIDWHFFTFP